MSLFDCLDSAYRPGENRADLDYFLSLQAYSMPDAPEYTPDRWDRRADFWEQERRSLRKDDERVDNAVEFLTRRGILTPECSVADIGCGPGRFAAAFAGRARRVVGFDISPRMVAYGNAHIQRVQLKNAELHCRDFSSLDLKAEGYEKAFDLVFASMTPAIHNPAGLQKAMDMSRGWCLSISHIRRENRLRDQIVREVFGREPRKRGEGREFYALFNILFLLGYAPETSFFTRQKITRARPDQEYAAYVMEHALPVEEHTGENAQHILRWLQSHAGEDGLLTEVSNGVYGRILWDVRSRCGRPDYRSLLEQGDVCTFF